MRSYIVISLLAIISSSGCFFPHSHTMVEYINHDFHNSYRKYLIKDGYVKYFAVDTSAIPDTSWIEIYFDDFGAREYIHFKSKSIDAEWYKTDSIQYAKSWNGHFESPEKRKGDVTTEKVVVNSTSRHGNGAYTHKATDRKFIESKKYKKLVGGFCWTYLNADSGKVDCDVLYYYGVPIDIDIYSRENYQYRTVRAEMIDTMVAFPVVLRIITDN